MSKVHIIENPIYTVESEIAIKLPDYKFLTFDLDRDYFENEITNSIPQENFYDFICCCDEHDYILDSSIRKGLTTLSYILYMTTNSINETVKKLNSLDIEEVVWCMVCDDVIDRFRALYNKA